MSLSFSSHNWAKLPEMPAHLQAWATHIISYPCFRLWKHWFRLDLLWFFDAKLSAVIKLIIFYTILKVPVNSNTAHNIYIECVHSVQLVERHCNLWDVDTCNAALKTEENYFPSLRVFADKAKFCVSSCRQNDPSQLAPMHSHNRE